MGKFFLLELSIERKQIHVFTLKLFDFGEIFLNFGIQFGIINEKLFILFLKHLNLLFILALDFLIFLIKLFFEVILYGDSQLLLQSCQHFLVMLLLLLLHFLSCFGYSNLIQYSIVYCVVFADQFNLHSHFRYFFSFIDRIC